MKSNCTEKKCENGNKGSGGGEGGEEEGDVCGDWVSMSNVLMRPA